MQHETNTFILILFYFIYKKKNLYSYFILFYLQKFMQHETKKNYQIGRGGGQEPPQADQPNDETKQNVENKLN